MSPQPFVERPAAEPSLRFCQDYGQHFWTDYPHACPAENPLRAAEGIFLALCGAVVLWSLLYLAGVIRWGLWPFN